MPVCGGGNKKGAPILAQVSIRAFHGGADETVCVEAIGEWNRALCLAGVMP